MPTLKVVSNLGKTVHVQPGDVYEFIHNTVNRWGQKHARGSKLHVQHNTADAPDFEIGEAGYNWRCRTDFGIAVWATLEQCISRGLLKKVDPT